MGRGAADLRRPADHRRDVHGVERDRRGPQIKGNYRAIEIPLDDNPVMLGTLKAGDHVDLIGTYTVHPTNGGSDVDVSRIIVRDVEVIKAPDTEAIQGWSRVPGEPESVTLKVPDTVVPKITFTLQSGELWFALRPGNGAQDGPTTLATASSVIFDGLTSKQIAQAIRWVTDHEHVSDQGLHHRRVRRARRGARGPRRSPRRRDRRHRRRAGQGRREAGRVRRPGDPARHDRDRSRPHRRDRGDPRRHRRPDHPGHVGERQRHPAPRRWLPASSTSCCSRS